ncbi:hypothetical protein DSO57_1015984 [Entomophthora muscae]|uniref:Uncharacterized protein n=1 Tax=Entomophthora muscae TaxID=34485 RepID=A0ACC2U3K6_9FUNG|nr:hypothetical protein DSO57_1015984 [Entomophthora muscae]
MLGEDFQQLLYVSDDFPGQAKGSEKDGYLVKILISDKQLLLPDVYAVAPPTVVAFYSLDSFML